MDKTSAIEQDFTGGETGSALLEKDAAVFGDSLLKKAGLTGKVFFDGSQFYFQDRYGEWQPNNRKVVESHLKYCGLAPVCDQKEKMSELEYAVKHICVNCRVDYAAPLAGYREGVHENNGHRILVTKSFKLPEPKEGEFPTIRALIDQQLAPRPGEGIDQRPHLYGYWKHSLECLLHGYEKNLGMCLVLAGQRGCGKSLLKDLIKASLGGRECQPHAYLVGRDNFCGEFLRAELWSVDDDQCQTDAKSRDEMATKIKKIVADEIWHVRGKHVEALDVKIYRRLVICVNDEPEKLLVLPQLHDDIIDKILMLHCLPPGDDQDPMPMPVKTPEEQDAFKRTLMQELPAFMYWLLNVYAIPPEMFGRFGIAHFQNPDIKSVLFALSPENALLEQIERTCLNELTWVWHGNATELYKLLTNDDASALTHKERNTVRKPIWLGRQLARIASQHSERCRQMQDADGTKEWYICRSDRTLEGTTPARLKWQQGNDGDEII